MAASAAGSALGDISPADTEGGEEELLPPTLPRARAAASLVALAALAATLALALLPRWSGPEGPRLERTFSALASGERACEGHGYSRSRCDAVGCCQYSDGRCWSAVGDDACTAAGDAQSGERACEGHGYKEAECRAIGCCHYGGGECWSAVGGGACAQYDAAGEDGDEGAEQEGDEGEDAEVEQEEAKEDPDENLPSTRTAACHGEPLEFGVAPLPGELKGYRKYMSKYVSVFGIPIIAEEAVPNWRLQHAGHVMAQYLDYDLDGEVNNPRVLKRIKDNGGRILMFTDPESETLDAVMDDEDLEGQDLNNDDIPRHVLTEYARRLRSTNSTSISRRHNRNARVLFANLPNCSKNKTRRHSGSRRDCAKPGLHPKDSEKFEEGFDGALEEILHMIWSCGYEPEYPEALGLESSKLTQAMDKQIGDCGYAFNGTLKYPHCSGTYHYGDETCDYPCLAIEYQFWTLTSILGAQDGTSRWATHSRDGRCEEIHEEWELCGRSEVEAKDPAIVELYDLESENPYRIPSRLPKGRYCPSKNPSLSMAIEKKFYNVA